jgi:hypothetical protein
MALSLLTCPFWLRSMTGASYWENDIC